MKTRLIRQSLTAAALGAAVILLMSGGWSCTTYRTYNSIHWAKEAYKQGMNAKKQAESQRRGVSSSLSRGRRARGGQVPGAEYFEEAARKCLAFLAQAPEGRRSDDALILMGKAFYELGRYIQAESSFLKLLDTQPKSGFRDDAIYYLVLIELARDDPGLAELRIERLIDEYPESDYRPMAQYMLGQWYLDTEDYVRALEVLTGVYDNYEDFDNKSEVLAFMARIHFELGEYERSLELYAKLNEDGGDNELEREGLIGMARSNSRLGRHQEAMALYQRALEESRFEDQRAEARLGINIEYTFLDSTAKALEGFEEIILDNPRTEYSAAAWYEMGLIYKNYMEHPDLDSIVVDSAALAPFALSSSRLEQFAGLSQRLTAYRLAEMSFTKVRREDPYSLMAEPSDEQAGQVQDLYDIYEQIEASDSTSSREALARLEFLLAEYHENTGDLERARAGYERMLLKYPNTIWAPKAALDIARVSEQLGDSLRAKQAREIVLEHFPDTRYADRVRLELGMDIPERPAGFYMDELAAYTPPRIERRQEGAGPGGLGPGGRPQPGQETWLQMRRRLWFSRNSSSGGGA